jgi:Raf kinase inhibitor-like YbhB/YbcL family protein
MALSGRKFQVPTILGGILVFALMGTAEGADAAAVKKVKVRVEDIRNNGPIPAEYAFCVPSPQGHTTSGANKNLAITWSKGPAGTQSYAIIVVDTDVPSVFDDADKEGKVIKQSLPRQDFYHMVLVDIPASQTRLAMGADSNGITPKGKKPGATPNGLRGVNDYTGDMSGDMAGNYGGYDGPCPPWNDERLHHYHFIVYAIDVPTLGLSGNFTGQDARAATAKHALAKGEVVGTYTQNPELMKKTKATKSPS